VRKIEDAYIPVQRSKAARDTAGRTGSKISNHKTAKKRNTGNFLNQMFEVFVVRFLGSDPRSSCFPIEIAMAYHRQVLCLRLREDGDE